MRAGFLASMVRQPDDVFCLRNATTGAMVATRLEPALDSRTRRRGLLGRSGLPEGVALVIAPSNAVHTFFMRFPIDVIFVARDGRVLKVRPGMPARRVAVAVTAFAVVEMAASGGDRVRAGDTLEVIQLKSGAVDTKV